MAEAFESHSSMLGLESLVNNRCSASSSGATASPCTPNTVRRRRPLEHPVPSIYESYLNGSEELRGEELPREMVIGPAVGATPLRRAQSLIYTDPEPQNAPSSIPPQDDFEYSAYLNLEQSLAEQSEDEAALDYEGCEHGNKTICATNERPTSHLSSSNGNSRSKQSPLPALPSCPRLDEDVSRFPSLSPKAEMPMPCRDLGSDFIPQGLTPQLSERKALQDMELNTWQQTQLVSAMQEASEATKRTSEAATPSPGQLPSSCLGTDSTIDECSSSQNYVLSSEFNPIDFPLDADLYNDRGSSLTGQDDLHFDPVYGVFRGKTPKSAGNRKRRQRQFSEATKRPRVGESNILPDPGFTKSAEGGTNGGMFLTFRWK